MVNVIVYNFKTVQGMTFDLIMSNFQRNRTDVNRSFGLQTYQERVRTVDFVRGRFRFFTTISTRNLLPLL